MDAPDDGGMLSTASDRAPCTHCGGVVTESDKRFQKCAACREKPAKKKTAKKTKEVIPTSDVVKVPGVDLAEKVSVELKGPSANEATFPYWVGTIEDCPIQNVTCGGICFHRFIGTPTFTVDEETKELVSDQPLQYGQYADLPMSTIEAIRGSVVRKVIRMMGKGNGGRTQRGILMDLDAKDHRPSAADVPLAKFLYMMRRDSPEFRGRDGTTPEVMLKE